MKSRLRSINTQEAVQQMNTKKQLAKNNNYIVEYVVSLSGIQTQKIYIKHELLGRGGFANCYVTQQIGSDQLMATKIIEKNNLKSSRSRLRLINQIKIHKTFSNPNIVQFIHHFEDYQNVYIMLELCQNQSLNQLLKQRKTLTYPQVQSFIYGICNGIKYLHDKKYIHRDLKLANIFLNDRFQVKIGDFGLTSQLEFLKENKRTVCGTPNYIAPQVLEGIGYYFQVDIWAIGIIMYTLFYGYPPFQSENTPEIYSKIKKCLYGFPRNKNVPIQAISLIRSILVPQPQKRPTIDEILNHPFMKLGAGIPLELPDICNTRPPTKFQIQQMPLLITKPKIFKQLKIKQNNYIIQNEPELKQKKSDNKSTIDKTISRDCNCMFTGPDYQQRYTPLNMKSVNQKNFGTKLQIPLTKTASLKQPKKVVTEQILDHVIQFQQIDENSFYFCMSSYAIGIYQKNREISYRHLYDFQNNLSQIRQIKLYNNLFSEECHIPFIHYKHKAILTVKAKQLLKTLKKQNLVQKKQLCNHKSNLIKTAPQKLTYITRITQHKQMIMLKLSNKCIQLIYQNQKNGFFYTIQSQHLYFYQNLNKPQMHKLVLSNIADIVNNFQKNAEKVKKTPNIQTCIQVAESNQYIKVQIINLIHIYGIIKQLQNKKTKHSKNRNSQ